MKLVGRRYATFLAEVDGQLSIVKAQDLAVADRRPVRCHRERLAYLLGTRLGLLVPETRLLLDDWWGRISVQHFITGARALDETERRCIAPRPLGIRILVHDVLCANHDRRAENLLCSAGLTFAVDHNVAFSFAGTRGRSERPEHTVMRWLGSDGDTVPTFPPWRLVETEASRLEHLVSEAFVRFAVAELDPRFVDAEERELLVGGLLDRRANMRSWLEVFWRESLAPFEQMTQEA